MEAAKFAMLDENPEKAGVQLSPPWVTYFKMIYNLLEKDEEITMPEQIEEVEPGVYSFYIESSNSCKIISLSKILKNVIQMGNITVKIEFRCTNAALITATSDDITPQDYKDAFENNPYFVEVVSIKSPVGVFNYAVFSRDIITFFNDDLTDYCNNTHYIVADIVREIVNASDISPCTLTDRESE